MGLTFHPEPGLILLCDFSTGFKEPEMVKSGRPVIVVSPRLRGREGLVTVVALSTAKPDPVMPFHFLLPQASLPQLGEYQGPGKETWVKGDMIYAVGFHRLELIRLGKRDPTTGKRVYFRNRLGRDHMKQVYSCIMHGLNMGHLCQHI